MKQVDAILTSIAREHAEEVLARITGRRYTGPAGDARGERA